MTHIVAERLECQDSVRVEVWSIGDSVQQAYAMRVWVWIRWIGCTSLDEKQSSSSHEAIAASLINCSFRVCGDTSIRSLQKAMCWSWEACRVGRGSECDWPLAIILDRLDCSFDEVLQLDICIDVCIEV